MAEVKVTDEQLKSGKHNIVKSFGLGVRFDMAMEEKSIFYEPQFYYLENGTICENYSIISMI